VPFHKPFMKKPNIPTPAPNPDRLPASISLTTLSELCGLSVRRMRDLAAEGKLPKVQKSRLPTREAIQRLYAHFKAQQTTVAEARARKVDAEARIKSIQADEAEGSFFPKVEVERGMNDLAARLRNAVISYLCRRLPIAVQEAAPQELKQSARVAVEGIGMTCADECLAVIRQAADKLKDTRDEATH
jgi:hypothetical protein